MFQLSRFVVNLAKHVKLKLIHRNFAEHTKLSSAKSAKQNIEMDRIRNIGIMAHIDAGKTTTTERMLFYSGFTRHMGDIDDGDTVMDYMEQERDRGITIVSAAITFNWLKHRINLIDTPGHVDFTYEVERALRVLDGAVAVIDASAGVEAQTVTVWGQANKYNIPRIAYHNKMDKLRANFYSSVNSTKEKLGANPLIVQIPVGTEKQFSGVVDLITMEKLIWPSNDIVGNKYDRLQLSESSDGSLYLEAMKYREELLEQLADIDDSIAENLINDVEITETDIRKALRKATLTGKGIPTLCGSSVKNKGVQPLLDAIVNYLPSPGEIEHDFLEYYKDSLCTLAFKIVHDQHRGALTFLRIYSGSLKSGDTIFNINQGITEKPSRILQIYADDHKETSNAREGNIVALSGLRMTKTGDTIVTNASASLKAANLKKELQKIKKQLAGQELSEIQDSEIQDSEAALVDVEPPDPVFFCSVEPPSLSEQKQLELALQNLEREDPSLRVRYEEETGQTVLEGMGELHLEIIKDRILKEYGVDVFLGPLQIAYRETITDSGSKTHTLKQVIGKRQYEITMNLSVHPVPGSGMQSRIILRPSEECPDLIQTLHRNQIKAINRGLVSSLLRGPILKSKVVDVEVRLHEFATNRGYVMDTLITACTSACIQQALAGATSVLMEPMMYIEIQTADKFLGTILSDLSNRRSNILEVQAEGELRSVRAQTPLAELVGYATYLRTMTSGTAVFTMELAQYHVMSSEEQRRTVEKVTNFMM